MSAPSACQFYGNNIDVEKLSDLSGATINMLLTTSAYTPDTTNTGHTVLANITNELANGQGYLTGGVALSAPTIATFSTTGFKFSTGNASWTASDRKSTRLNSSHTVISYAVFCLKKKKLTERLSDDDVVVLELVAQLFGRKPVSQQTTEGFERCVARPTRGVADRQQDLYVWLSKV